MFTNKQMEHLTLIQTIRSIDKEINTQFGTALSYDDGTY